MSATSAPVPTNNRNNQQSERPTTQTVYPPVKLKCEFCDVSFERDIDVGRHLISQVHIGNRNNFLAIHNPRDKVTEKQVPKNFTQVLQTLKLRSVRDLKELTEKGYFAIKDANTAELAEDLARKLVRFLVEFESKDLPDQVREILRTAVLDPPPTDPSEPDTRQRSVPARVESTKTHSTVASGAKRSAPPQQPQPQTAPDPPRAPRPIPKSTRAEPTQTSLQTTSRKEKVARTPQPRPPPNHPQPSTSKTTNQAISANNPNPVPRKDSKYIPKLATVKVEPRD